MAMLASGSAGAKAIGALSVPVITRIYLPEHFGVLAVFTSSKTWPHHVPLCLKFTGCE